MWACLYINANSILELHYPLIYMLSSVEKKRFKIRR